jgi:hypothetical protein
MAAKEELVADLRAVVASGDRKKEIAAKLARERELRAALVEEGTGEVDCGSQRCMGWTGSTDVAVETREHTKAVAGAALRCGFRRAERGAGNGRGCCRGERCVPACGRERSVDKGLPNLLSEPM